MGHFSVYGDFLLKQPVFAQHERHCSSDSRHRSVRSDGCLSTRKLYRCPEAKPTLASPRKYHICSLFDINPQEIVPFGTVHLNSPVPQSSGNYRADRFLFGQLPRSRSINLWAERTQCRSNYLLTVSSLYRGQLLVTRAVSARRQAVWRSANPWEHLLIAPLARCE